MENLLKLSDKIKIQTEDIHEYLTSATDMIAGPITHYCRVMSVVTYVHSYTVVLAVYFMII